ncbi:HD-GYP domain-containing protein [Roseburia sp. NSJ-9]|uniref:HD-GYP domain-containing protein n=1 Tax=Roseburia lenta TaxID=2763061 RepID=A0ABR7GHR2_9FIRM|nr:MULTISPECIES: HD-GYP domain-containing protein [Roseburia]MBC5686755.1 HD-GYP domain-containing protein [Roseburia lenta]RHO30774.1 HD-GYP domain-containing protein [Roseburia sp. AM16-25]
MVTYPLNELQPGMIVAADVFTPRGQLIVLRGSILSQQMIQHMKYYHVPSVTILPNEIDPMSFEKADRSEPTYAKRIRQSESFKEFREHYTQSASIFQEQLSRFVAGDAHLDTSALLQDTLELFDHNRASFSLLDMLHNMRDLDDSTYVHSINVAVISRLIGMWSDLDEANLDVLTLCGLLHDVGKVQIPDEILEKPDRLTPEEYEIMKTHTVLGYRMMERERIDKRIKNAALMHHERFDGKGYPFGLTGDRIDTFASIVAIADVYDALTSDRCYRSAVCPFEVIALFESNGLTEYNPKFILTFLEHIAQTYVGNSVRLSDGSQGKISMIDTKKLLRPLIQLESGEFVDLSKRLDLYVEEII